ncbi:MAG TPA: SRPBCC domain-containing protein [Flavipsychrobacter sp.]|nr:SRPBCC domain-containing protein [Flavipsychrobacter sp.]
MQAKTEPIIVERVFNAPIARVWQAITDKDKMKEWYFNIDAFEPKVGFKFQFIGGSDSKKYTHLCEITEVIPEKKLTYSWRYKDYEGNSSVTFELFADGDKTRLKLTHTGLETFPQDTPDFARKSFAAGWDYIVNTSLKNYLEKM